VCKAEESVFTRGVAVVLGGSDITLCDGLRGLIRKFVIVLSAGTTNGDGFDGADGSALSKKSEQSREIISYRKTNDKKQRH
jgi:hypothetical protein